MKSKAVDLVITHNKLDQTVRIVELLLSGLSMKQVSKEVGVTYQWVYLTNKKYIRGSENV